MHRKGPAFLTDMGLLMFLAVTASLLGYCQTDEKGKTQRRDSTFLSLLLTIPFSPFSLPLSILFILLRRQRGRALKEIRILLSTSPLGRAEGRRGEEIATGREKERRRLTFMAAGMSSSREFTYSERAKEKREREREKAV